MRDESTRSAAVVARPRQNRGQGGAAARRRREVRHLHTALTRSGYRARFPTPPKEVLVRFVVRLLVLACLAAALVAPAASAADRMWVGFHDDPVLRFDGGRTEAMDRARGNGASVVRTLIDWSKAAPTRPTDATDPFDPAYRFDDVDEVVRNAQQRGLEVMITLWGTPSWANGGQKPQAMPSNIADFQSFARAVASRYSGRYAGYPFVRFYTDLERVEPRHVPRPAVQREGPYRQPGELREAREGRDRRHQGGQPQRARRDRRDVVERPRQASGRPHRHRCAGHVHEGRRRGPEGRQVRRLGAPSRIRSR